ncbi:hypothetical protein [Variovorax sp. DT-64]|uniref:hypothetical protein n=1 Tax=Variovorax sp. DT-64 TaxID=3396160 RepID=UPI003F1CB9F3
MQRSSSSSLSSSNSHSYSTDTPPKVPPKVPPTGPQGGGGLPTDEIPARPEIPALTFDIEDVKKTFDKRIAARERGRERGLTRQSALPAIHRIASKNLPRALRKVQQELPQQDIRAINLITAHARGLVAHPDGHGKPDLSDNETLSADVQHIMECMQAAVANHQGDGPEAKQERRCMLINHLGAVCRNDFRSDAGRRAANTANVLVHTVFIMVLAKLVEDAVEFEVSKAAALGGQEGSLRIAGILALILAPTLNVLGGILSGVLGTANPTSVVSRLWLGMLYLGLLLACYETDVLGTLAAKLSPVAIYCLLRDGLNFWFPFSDNVESISKLGVLGAGGIYSLINAFAGMLIGKTLPTAGAGALPRTGNETERMMPEHLAALQNAVLDLPASLGSALTWAAVEVGDDLILPTILRWIQTREYRKKEAVNMQVEAAHSKYIGELTELAKVLLETPRKERQKKIDDKNLELYQREFQRMRNLDKDQLDKANRQYLEDLRKELRVYRNTQILGQMWEALSRDPDCYSAEQLAHLKSIEVALGVYKKTRELDRLRRLDNSRINEAQRRDLAELQETVDGYQQSWQRLRHADPSELGADQDLLKLLAHEFISTDQKPARLRPISALRSDVKSTLDFTRFDKMIRHICRLHDDLRPEEHEEIVRELYSYELVRLYLPGSLTPVEQDVLASMFKEKPATLPSDLLTQLVEEVADKRREKTEGIRIGIRFQPTNVSSTMEAVERLGRQLLVTDSARQSALGAVFALLVLMDGLMGDRIKDSDENTQLTIWNLMAGFGIFMVYWALILMHSEGARGGGVYRPGAERTLPPLQGRQETQDPFTPRTERYEPDDRGISETVSDSDAVSETDSDSTYEHIPDSDEDIELGAIPTPRVWEQ